MTRNFKLKLIGLFTGRHALAAMVALIAVLTVAPSAGAFGSGNAAWKAYYSAPGDESTWEAFCNAGGGREVAHGDGVMACGPTGATSIEIPGGISTPGFQCVELSERFLYITHRWTTLKANGAQVAKDYAAAHHVPLIANGTAGVAPHVGDVMSFSNSSSFSDEGHTGVVIESAVNSGGNGTIKLLSENVSNTGRADTFAVSAWKVAPVYGFAHSEWVQSGIGQSSQSGFEVAFQANTSDLWTVGSDGNSDWRLGMMQGTSPSVAALPNGGFEVAFQANTSDLWAVGSDGNSDWRLGMMQGTSPSVAALPNGGFEVAFQANTGDLWTVGSDGNTDWKLGMRAGTSPSITGLPNGGFEVAFQANTSYLWTVGSDGAADWKLGMMSGTSPSIAGLPNGGFEAAFQANTSDLWSVGSDGSSDWHLGMRAGTSPSITGLPNGGFEVAFQANTSDLWSVGSDGNSDWHLGMRAGTSPSITG